MPQTAETTLDYEITLATGNVAFGCARKQCGSGAAGWRRERQSLGGRLWGQQSNRQQRYCHGARQESPC